VIEAPKLLKPHVRLYGSVDDAMFDSFHRQMDAAPNDEAVVVELMTFGGDADVGRRLALEIRMAQKHLGRTFYFVGKTVVYSAGITIMAAFPQANRCLTSDTILLIHDRRTERQVNLSGPLSAGIIIARAALSQLEIGMQLEQEGFAELIAGSDITQHEINRLAATNWYFTAEEALNRKLVASLL
jgi:ATP-dependent protease ClpP protease subunit